MKTFRGSFRLLVLLASIAVLAGCGGSSSSDDPSSSGNTISGVASKGPIDGGSVEVYSLLDDGTKGDLLGTDTTGADGSFTIDVGNYSGAALVEVRGGAYIDEATGLPVENILLRAGIPAVSSMISMTVTPLTELAVANAEKSVGLTSENIEASNTFISELFGGVNIITIEPIDVLSTPTDSVTQDQIDYGLMLAAISQMVVNDPTFDNVNQVVDAMSVDLLDGILDETAGELIAALTNFLDSGRNATTVATLDAMIIDDVVAEQQVLREVYAVYSTNGSNWNDYVKNDGLDIYNATGTACEGTETGGYDACIHGGEKRSFDTGLSTACIALTATDALGAFDWVCDDSGVTTVFYSTGLSEGKNLSDLINFTTPGWKYNQLIVNDGVSNVVKSKAMIWWDNPIIEANDGGSLAASGMIYVVTADPQNIFTIDADQVGLVVKPGVTMTGSTATTEKLVSAATQNFLWLEGAMDATGDQYAIYLLGVKFSALRGISAEKADSTGAGIYLSSSSDNMLSEISATNNTNHGVILLSSSNNMLSSIIAGNNNYGVFLFSSSNNSLLNIRAANNANSGIFLQASSDNTLSDISANNNVNSGVSIYSSSDNTLSDISAANNDYGISLLPSSNGNRLLRISAINNNYGIIIESSSNNTLSSIIASNNHDAVYIYSSSNNNILSGISVPNNFMGVSITSSSNNNMLSGISATNNGGKAITLHSSSNNMLSGISVANNGDYGILIYLSSNNTLSDIAAVHNGTYGIGIGSSLTNYFTGLLKVGNNGTADCGVSGGTDPGLFDGTCANQGTLSDATLSIDVTLAESYLGKKTVDDAINASDTNGAATFPTDPAAFDWTCFDNIYSSWGKDGSTFPNVDHAYFWKSGAGRIWDWSLLGADTVIRDVLALPGGNDTLEHGWTGTAADQAGCDVAFPGSIFNAADDCRSTFLRHAVELSGDGVGNDNLLCETGEECLYTPNIASYQGHGALISAGTIGTGDSIENVTLWKYETNGY